MFTGIIQKIGKVKRVQKKRHVHSFEILISPWPDSIKSGESIAVNGVCLTAKKPAKNLFSTDVVPATLRATTFRSIKAGDSVNVERSLKLGDRLGGHYVSGHVDARGQILANKKYGKSSVLHISIPAKFRKYLIEKGSIAINGVSLTAQKLTPKGLEAALIPHTAKKTVLGDLKIGDEVNIEIDMMVKKFFQRLKRNVSKPKHK